MTRAVITYFPSRRTKEPVDTPPIPPQKTTEGRTSSRAHTEPSSLVIVYLGSWTLASHRSNVALWSSGRTSGSADLTDWRGRAAAKAKLPTKTPRFRKSGAVGRVFQSLDRARVGEVAGKEAGKFRVGEVAGKEAGNFRVGEVAGKEAGKFRGGKVAGKEAGKFNKRKKLKVRNFALF